VRLVKSRVLREGSTDGRDFLNGLEVARRFFAEWGLPFLQEHFPELAERTAAGLFRGSQVLGVDDALSRDHGWGPMFLLLLTQEDYTAQGQAVKHRPWSRGGHARMAWLPLLWSAPEHRSLLGGLLSRTLAGLCPATCAVAGVARRHPERGARRTRCFVITSLCVSTSSTSRRLPGSSAINPF